MFKLFSSREAPTSFQQFLQNVKQGNRDFFTLLNTPESCFEEASFSELMSNADDVLSRVNRVQKNFRNIYFGVFDGCLIKHHDNGEVKWVFFTVTKDSKRIFELVDTLN